jgi:hypothetical protein
MLPGMKNPFIRIGIAVVVIVLVAGGVWLFTHKNNTPVLSDALHATSSIAPLASVSPFAIAYTTPPSDWKTYSSASMDFSVAYPSDWTFSDCGPQCVGWAPSTATNGQLALGIVKSTTKLAAVLEQAKPYIAKNEQVKIGANTWTKLTLQHPTTGDVVTSYFITHGASLYEFGTATADASILAVYGQMIDSFKFLK